MSEHKATIRWRKETESFAYADYNREHSWDFENGLKLTASAAPQFQGHPDCLDPEEAFVASLSSCHMLTLLAICAKKRRTVLSYTEQAVGFLEESEAGQLVVARVELHPHVEFQDWQPTTAELEKLHDSAHHHCFIANSVKTEIQVVLSPDPSK